jgi:hypothetical protein
VSKQSQAKKIQKLAARRAKRKLPTPGDNTPVEAAPVEEREPLDHGTESSE